jgi:hypothetical protein
VQALALTSHPNQAPRLKQEQRYTSITPWWLYGLIKGELYLFAWKSQLFRQNQTANDSITKLVR